MHLNYKFDNLDTYLQKVVTTCDPINPVPPVINMCFFINYFFTPQKSKTILLLLISISLNSS